METDVPQKKHKALTSTCDILFTLLRNGLYADRKPEMIPELTVDEWEGLLEEAGRQTVTGTVYHGLSRLGSTYPLPSEVLFRFVAEANRIELESRQKEQVAWNEFQRLKGEGFHPVVMKGPAVARFYPAPMLRESGDIDIYLRGEEFRTLCDSLEGTYRLSDGSIHYDRQGVDFDLHDKYFDLHLPAERLPEVPSPYATLLMLSAHILKHASGPGVGLRQFCDMAVACEKLSFDPAVLLETYRKAGLWKWSILLHAFLRKYLGLKDIFEGALPTADPSPLLRIVLEGGNFGHHGPRREKVLGTDIRQRKIDTALRYVRRLPFSLKYAPRETFRYLGELIRGNLRREATTAPQ